ADLSDAEITLLRDGVRILRARSAVNPLDPRGWYAYAQLHSAFCGTNTYEDQVHYGWFFLPWHRGYLIALEQLLQETVGEPQLALPYWDWTTSPQIPRAYAGPDNALSDPTRIMQPDDIMPWDLLTVGSILRAPTWNSFGGHPRLDPTAPQIEGCMEQGCHNNTHNWMGGNIASFSGAGYDPVFHTHHGQIDRLWAAWLASDPTKNQNPADPRFLEKRFFFYGPNGAPFALRVGDMLDTEACGYRFDSLAFNLNVRALPIYRDAAEKVRDDFVSAGELVRTPVSLDPTGRRALLAALGSPRARVILQFERKQLPIHPYCVRIYLGTPGEAAPSGPTDQRFVGTYTYLPIPGLELGLDRHCVTQIEVTEQHAALLRSGSPLIATLVPVQLRDRVIPPQSLEVQNASLRIDA
ncbi:MAG: tyrosinase family protein, partial [Opitutaceae bacterium]|nr:tyrosinase family protein [Opitutaceae bacterium]